MCPAPKPDGWSHASLGHFPSLLGAPRAILRYQRSLVPISPVLSGKKAQARISMEIARGGGSPHLSCDLDGRVRAPPWVSGGATEGSRPPPLLAVSHTLSPVCFVTVGIRGAAAGGLQSEQQCPRRSAGHRGGRRHGRRHQPGDAEEEAVRHHQPRDRGGEPPGALQNSSVSSGAARPSDGSLDY